MIQSAQLFGHYHGTPVAVIHAIPAHPHMSSESIRRENETNRHTASIFALLDLAAIRPFDAGIWRMQHTAIDILTDVDIRIFLRS